MRKTISPGMKNVILSLCFLFSLNLQAQYYFNDIIGTEEANRQMQTYKANKVRSASATGYNKQGVKENNFSEFQEVKENGMVLKNSTINNLNKTVVYNRYDNQAKLISSTDSSSGIQSTTGYEYDGAGKITRIQNTVKDPANDFNQTETHQWIYNSSGKPEKMWRIITSATATTADSLEIRFITDENGNTTEEKTFRKGVETGYLYYYYDDKNRITDVVRYNTKLKKLLPDFMFEYDENDRVIQKITTTSSRNLGYLIWRYIFDAKGLKTKEALFNDDKELTGKIEYSYTFGQ
jgi:YD repeat-containing protein